MRLTNGSLPELLLPSDPNMPGYTLGSAIMEMWWANRPKGRASSPAWWAHIQAPSRLASMYSIVDILRASQ